MKKNMMKRDIKELKRLLDFMEILLDQQIDYEINNTPRLYLAISDAKKRAKKIKKLLKEEK